MKPPHHAAHPPTWPTPGNASDIDMAPGTAPGPPVRPVIQITVTVVLPNRLTWLLTAFGALLQVLIHGR
jgi:hypothetical protein